MPKREKTPDAEDEPRFLVINHPYPLHANMEDMEDAKTLARWLGCIVSPPKIIALHHKPSARNMVIVEIDRTCTSEDWRRLLGAHRWNEFLVSPSSDEEDRVSKIFYCQYTTGRLVQKTGWKRIYAEDTWFIPSVGNKAVHFREGLWESMKKSANLICIPYPLSQYCDLPTSEDPTNSALARPLPVEHFPRVKYPLVTPDFVVGSDQWVDTKLKSEVALPEGKPKSRAKKPSPTTFQDNVSPSFEQRGRAQTKGRPGPVGVTMLFGPPVLPPPFGRSLPPITSGLTSTTNSFNSSDLDFLEIQTAAALRIDDDYCAPDVVVAGLDIAADVNSTQETNKTEILDSLWDHRPSKVEISLCKAHGKACARGICKEYADQLKQEKQEKYEREKAKAKNHKRGRGGTTFGVSSRGKNFKSNKTGNGGRGAKIVNEDDSEDVDKTVEGSETGGSTREVQVSARQSGWETASATDPWSGY